MTFRLADVKKTIRARSDGERYLHPKLLDAVAVGPQMSLALAYFQARLGRPRHDLDPEMLVRFFSDPKVARGLVACLNTIFRWQALSVADVLDQPTLGRLKALGIHTPTDARLYCYDLLNAGSQGFLQYLPDAQNTGREERLRPLARRLHLSPAKLDQLIALDAEEHAVLVRVGQVPSPEQVVALYNFQVVDTLLRNCATVELTDMTSAGQDALFAACSAYEVTLTHEGEFACLHNRADGFGSYARWGRRVVLALYATAVAVPTLLTSGRAVVQVGGKRTVYLFDKRTRQALTAQTGCVYSSESMPQLRLSWDRLRMGRPTGQTAGWRLLSSPDPLLSPAGLVLAPCVYRRDNQEACLWLVRTPEQLAQVVALHKAGVKVLPMVSPSLQAGLPTGLPFVPADADALTLVAALSARAAPHATAFAQALDGLLAAIQTRGFVEEGEVIEALGCASASELPSRLQLLDPASAIYVPHFGLCAPAFAQVLRKGLRRRPRRVPAA